MVNYRNIIRKLKGIRNRLVMVKNKGDLSPEEAVVLGSTLKIIINTISRIKSVAGIKEVD